ncbi:MAG: helix-turn-helix transcriptional regulator [Chloroflexi bacterium]|nr:helix-turn-helix transcriptional regulator [Chloroflexota bacterium]
MAGAEAGLRFPEALRRARLARGLSYRALAACCGLSHSFLSHIEKGERRPPRMARVMAIAAALDTVTPAFLLAALADRVGTEATQLVIHLAQTASGGDPLPGALTEIGGADAIEALATAASQPDGEAQLRRALSFVDLQFDADVLRVGFGDAANPVVLSVVGPADPAAGSECSD